MVTCLVLTRFWSLVLTISFWLTRLCLTQFSALYLPLTFAFSPTQEERFLLASSN